MKIWITIFSLLAAALPLKAQDSCDTAALQHQIDAMTALQKQAHVINDSNQVMTFRVDFDVNEYLNIFKHISLAPGWRLDFIYNADNAGSFPIIYAYDTTAIRNLDSIKKRYSDVHSWEYTTEKLYDYLNHIQIDGSPQGYLEYVVLQNIGAQFLLQWHALYNDVTVVLNNDNIADILKRLCGNDQSLDVSSNGRIRTRGRIEDDFQERAMHIGTKPVVIIKDSYAEVRIVVFSKWGGFMEKRYRLSNAFPYRILNIKTKNLADYNCGIIY